MRLVAWNCAMALHRKLPALLALAPDLAVISECAHPDIIAARLAGPPPWRQAIWVGGNRQKGLGVFAFGDTSIDMSRRRHDPALRFIAPVAVSGPLPFHLLAVWAQNANDGIRRKDQPGPVSHALRRYRRFMAAAPCLLAGDFNNNVIWDRPGWPMNHAAHVATLARRGLVSLYHARSGEADGRETTRTHYWRDRRIDGPTYHIDYIFMPVAWLPRVRGFEIGGFHDWCGNGLSDHMPLTLDLAP